MSQYKTSIKMVGVTLVIAIAVIIVFQVNKSGSIKANKYETSAYSIVYDSTWKLKDKTDANLSLEYKKGITINFEIKQLEKEYLYMSLSNIMDEVEYSIREQNPNYGLIGKEPISVTKNNYSGYQLLYEDKDTQVLVMLARKGEQLLAITYQAPFDYFDILLDSVKENIYHFTLLDQTYETNQQLADIEFAALSLSVNNEVKVAKTSTYEIANNHYLVEYEIPSEFEYYSFDTTYGFFPYKSLKQGRIDLTTHVYSYNLYEYLANCKEGITYDIKEAKKNGKVAETYTKINDNEYIYHAKFKNERYEYDIIHMIYALDLRRVFIIAIEGQNNPIPQAMIDNIAMKKATNYAEHIKRDIKNGNLVTEMKLVYDRYSEPAKYMNVTLYTPQKYVEYDHQHNKYFSRYFGYEYENKNLEFKVRYELSRTSKESTLSSLEQYDFNGAKGKKLGIKKYNNKDFDTYYYEYKKNNNQYYAYVLFYTLEDVNLQIKLEAKGMKITENQLKEFTNFDMKKEEMNK